jgi:hypothetical protein
MAWGAQTAPYHHLLQFGFFLHLLHPLPGQGNRLRNNCEAGADVGWSGDFMYVYDDLNDHVKNSILLYSSFGADALLEMVLVVWQKVGASQLLLMWGKLRLQLEQG